MGRKRYQIYIDEDIFEGLRKKVEERGMKFSPYIEILLKENLETLTEMKDVKHIKDITIQQLYGLMSKYMKDFSDATKGKK